MKKEVAIGIDIGGTYTKIGLVDPQGQSLIESYLSTRNYESIHDYVKAVCDKIQITIESVNQEIDLKGIGVGAPNGNYYSGTIEYAPNLPWKGIINLTDMFQKYYDMPVVLTNDANAAAIGEMIYGAAKGMKNFIVITLGTGLGSGIVVNGELVYGHDGFAGEMGHTTVIQKGRQCSCGLKGCLETYVSATGITRTVFELLANDVVPSELRAINFNELNAKMIYEAAKRRDKIALEAFQLTGKILGQKLAETVALFSPEAIILFGGLAQSGDFIFQPTHHYMEKNMMPIFRNKVKLMASGFKDTNAAIMGASALVWKELGIVE